MTRFSTLPIAIGKRSVITACMLIMAIVFAPHQLHAQVNLALTATAAHSGGGATIYAATNYNDGTISAASGACTSSATPWGWVTTNGWITFTWSSAVTFRKIVLYKSNRPMTTCSMQYWNGSAFVTFLTYTGTTCTQDSVTFTPVTTTILRLMTVAGSSNPNHREIQVWSAPSVSPPTVTGPTTYCAGSTVTLTASSPAPSPTYSWTGPASFTATTAAISIPAATTANSGVYSVTVTSGGNTSAATTTSVTVNPSPTAISGSSAICMGTPATMTSSAGATWSSSSTAVATVGSTGIVTGVSAGTATISYTLSNGCSALKPITVGIMPADISGSTNGCQGQSTTLTSTAGGTWTSSNSSVASIGTSSGVMTGVAIGTATITYTLPPGCFVTAPVTINALPAPITGMGIVCPGSTLSLSNASAGGTWSSSNMALATVGSVSGVVTGVSGGNPSISYTLPSGCQVGAEVTVHVTAPITGATGLCTGYGSTLSNAISGGVWSSSSPFIASIGSASGVVTTASAGSAIIFYTFPNGCVGNTTVVVYTSSGIYTITGGGHTCEGSTGTPIGLTGSDLGVSYQLYNGGVPTGGTVTGTGLPMTIGYATAAGTYTVVANPGTPCSATMLLSASVVVDPAPIAYNVTGGGGYCADGSGVVVGLAGSEMDISYQLYRDGVATGSPLAGTTTILNFGAQTATGVYTVVATNTITGCVKNMTGGVTVTINPLPAVYAMTGSGAYCAGGTGLAIGLTNSETGVSYQLYRGSAAIGSPVSGTGSAVGFGNQTVAGGYTAVATNTTTGCVANMTSVATVTVTPMPAAYSMTGGGSYCDLGTGVPVGLTGSATGVSYVLYRAGVSTGITMTGTGASLSFGLQTVAGVYTAVANVGGCSVNMIGSATVAVNPLPTGGPVTGGGSYCAGTGGVAVGLASSAVGTSYSLYNSGVLVDASSGTGSPLDFGSQLAAGTYTVSATITGTGCTAVMGGSTTVTIIALPSVYNVTGGGSRCPDGAGLHVQLSNSASGDDYILLKDGAPVPGATFSGTGSGIDFGVFTAAGVYTVSAMNASTGCIAAMSGSATIVVNAAPVPYSVTGGGNYCAGGTGVNIGIDNTASGINYSLYRGATLVSTFTGTGAFSLGLFTIPGTYTITGVNTATGCITPMGGSAVVAVSTPPVAYTVTGGGNYCIGGSGRNIGLDNSEAGVSYQLYNGSIPVGSPATGTGSAVSFGLQATIATYTVKATNILAGCTTAMTGSATIGTDPLPALQTVTGGGNYCSGGAGVHVGVLNSATGTAYQVYNGGTSVGLAMSGISGTALDFGTFTGAGTYTVIGTIAATGCKATMNGSADINIDAPPVAVSVTGGGGYCAGGTGVPVGLASSFPGNTYQLYVNGSPLGAALTGTGTSIDFGMQTTGGTYTAVATTTATGCTAVMTGSANVTANALPASYTVTGGGAYCVGGTGVLIGLSGSNTGISYQLYNGSSQVGIPVAGTGSAISMGLQAGAGTYTIKATNNTTGCSNTMAGSAAVAIYFMSNVYTVTGGGAYCPAGSGVHVGLGGTDAGLAYHLYNGLTATGSPVTGTGSAIDFGWQTGAGNYTVRVASSGCTTTMSGSATVSISALPGMHTVTGGGSYCAGGTGIATGLDGTDIGTSYQLYNGTSVTGSPMPGTGAAISFGMRTAGTYTVRATDNATGCSTTMAGSAPVVVNLLPTAYTLSGGGSYCSGDAGVDVQLSGSDPSATYQLYNGLTSIGTAVTGIGAPLYFGAQTGAGAYTVQITTTTTGCTTTVGGVNVTINTLPTAAAVTGGGSYCIGGAGVHVGLAASGTGISYQLFNGAVVSGTPVAGTGTGIDFGIKTAGGSYTVVATNTATGCAAPMTGSATIIAGANPVVRTFGADGTGYCIGGAGVGMYLGSSDVGVSYQLYRGSAAIGTPLGGTGSGLSFGSQLVAGTYTAIAVDNATGCTSNMSGSANIAVYPLPDLHTTGGGGGFCTGSPGVSVTLSGSDPGVNYQLYQGLTATGSAIPGTGGPLDMGIQTISGTYTIMATDPLTGCNVNMNGVAGVAENSLPALYTVVGGGTYCSGGTGASIGLSSSNTGIVYQLYNGGTPMGSPVSGTGAGISFGPQTVAGSYTVIAWNAVTGCTAAMSGGAAVNVNTLPVAFTVTGGGGYCAGDAGTHIGLSNTVTGISYQLYNGTTASGAAVTGSGAAIDFGTRTAAGTYTVLATDGSTGCTAPMTGSTAISINPVPSTFTVTGGGSYCAGGSGMHIGLSNSTGGITYKLQDGITVAASVTGTGGAIDFGAIADAGSYTVVATNSTTGCSSTMTGSAAVAVNPVVTPSVAISTGSGDTVCAAHLVPFTAVAVNGGTSPSFRWQVNGVDVPSVGPLYTYIPVNGDVVSVTMTSSAACASTSVVGSSKTLVVNIPEYPSVSLSSGAVTQVCQGSAVTLMPITTYGGTAPRYNWVKNSIVVDSVSAVYSYIPANGDVVYCVLKSNYNCRLAETATSSSVTMDVVAPVTPVVSVTANPGFTVSTGTLVTFTAAVTNSGVQSPSYQWRVNGADVSGGHTAAYTTDALYDGDVVSCEVASGGVCAPAMGNASGTMHIKTVGVQQVGMEGSSIQLLPNPSKGTFTVKGTLGTASATNVSVEVTNMLGQVVYRGNAQVKNGEINELVTLSSATNGMYLLVIRTGHDSKVFHLVIEQ